MKSVKEKTMREFSETHQSLIAVFITTVDKITEEVINSETIPHNEKLDFLIGLVIGTIAAKWEEKA